MASPLRLLACLLAAYTASAAITQKGLDLNAGYFHGRSANIVFKPEETASPDAHVMFVDQAAVLQQDDQSSIPTQTISDVISRSFGVLPPHTDSPSFVQTSFFKRARANLVLSIMSVGSSLLQASDDLPNLRALAAKSGVKSLDLSESAFPHTDVATLASIATGRSPSEHGIVGCEWQDSQGETVKAYSSPQSASYRANVADILGQSFRGQSLTVSFSGTCLS